MSDIHIFVVDDTVANLKLMLAVLSEAGFIVHPINDSRQVIQQAHLVKPDLILLDVEMPHFNGYTVCQMLKAEPDLADIPVVLMSAAGAPLDLHRTKLVGAADYLEKPIVLEQVIQRIQAHLLIDQKGR